VVALLVVVVVVVVAEVAVIVPKSLIALSIQAEKDGEPKNAEHVVVACNT
jgi:hypothetical protein